jgi:tetratricopeptide (TPR) repeat protein
MLPTANRSAGLTRRLALLLVVLSVAGAAGWLWWSCLLRPDIYFLPRRAPAEWIIYPAAPQGAIHPRLEMSTVFRRSFTLERAPAKAVLSVTGLRQYTLSLNGKPAALPLRRGRNWKQPDQFEVAQQLRAGENQIAVTISNTNGPPVLWLSLDTDGRQLNSDEAWQTSYAGAVWRPARLASKPKVVIAGSPGYGGEEPWTSLQARWLALLLFTGLSAALYWFIAWRKQTSALAPRPSTLDLLPLLGLAGLWVALFANNLGVLPSLVGYDVDGHMAYIRYIQEHHCLPRADEGWEMFQSPLYYLLGAGLLNMLSLSVTQAGGVMALRVMGLGIGVAHFVVVWASLGLLFPGERSRPRWGLVLAAALPPLLYLSQYVSNEGLAAALVSASVCLTLRALKQEHVSWKLSAGLGLCLGAALLTKSSALMVVPVILGALGWRAVQSLKSNVQSRGPGDVGQASDAWKEVGRIGVVVAVCAVVCGWHYARVWARYGTPVIGVWDPRLGFSWWQDDGYRTGAFYLRFGEVLRHPWLSSFRSFGDGIYASLWGDGLFGGMADAVARPPWNYDLMAVGYWLALAPALAVMVGGILVLVRFLREPSAEWLLLLGLAFLAALAVVQMSIAVPYQCMVKAFYGLCALVPLCAFGAWGIDALCRWSGKLRPVICILFGVWAINSYAAFWISRSAIATVFSRTQSLWKEGRKLEAKELLQAGLARHPESAEAQSLLAGLLLETGDLQEAGQQAETALRTWPNNPKAHLVLAAVLTRLQKVEAATEHARQAVDLAPGDAPGYQQLADLLLRQERYNQAIRVAREGLAVAPFSPDLRFALGTGLVYLGETGEAISQLQLACAIKPNWAGPQVLLGTTLAGEGKLEDAAQHLHEAVRLEPGNAGAHFQLAAALSAQHQTTEAIAHYTEALRLEPDYAEALNNLAWVRAANSQAEFRNGPEAVRLAERACKVTEFKEPVMVGTLAAAYAEAGRFEEAVATARQARELALAGGQKDLAEKNLKLIELFSARKPYRAPAERSPQSE